MLGDSFESVPRLKNATTAIWAIVLGIAFLSSSADAEDAPSPNVAHAAHIPGPSIDERLNSITLSLDFNNATISEAARYLTIVSKKSDRDRRGVSFIVQPDALKEAKPVTLTLKDVSLGDALRNICSLGNVKFKLDKNEIDLVSIRETADGVNTTAETGSETSVAITHKLQSIVLPKVNWNKLDIAIMVQFLEEKSKQYDPDKKGINFALSTNGPADSVHREVTIAMDNVALSDLLPLISQQTNLRYSIENDVVCFKP